MKNKLSQFTVANFLKLRQARENLEELIHHSIHLTESERTSLKHTLDLLLDIHRSSYDTEIKYKEQMQQEYLKEREELGTNERNPVFNDEFLSLLELKGNYRLSDFRGIFVAQLRVYLKNKNNRNYDELLQFTRNFYNEFKKNDEYITFQIKGETLQYDFTANDVYILGGYLELALIYFEKNQDKNWTADDYYSYDYNLFDF